MVRLSKNFRAVFKSRARLNGRTIGALPKLFTEFQELQWCDNAGARPLRASGKFVLESARRKRPKKERA